MKAKIRLQNRDRQYIKQISQHVLGDDVYAVCDTQTRAHINYERRKGYCIAIATVLMVYLTITSGFHIAKEGPSLAVPLWMCMTLLGTFGLSRFSMSSSEAKKLLRQRIAHFGQIGWIEKLFASCATNSGIWAHLSLLVPTCAWFAMGTSQSVATGFCIIGFTFGILPLVLLLNRD